MATTLIFDTRSGEARVADGTKTLWSAPFGHGRRGTVPEAGGREGDEKTPLGTYPLRFGLYRTDRLPRPYSALAFHAIKPDDGWCDDTKHAHYNRLIRTPFAASHEAMWREDGAYDVVLVMGHNDDPPVPGRGSAVFIHCRQPDHRPTLGCLALAPGDLWTLAPHLRRDMDVIVA